jgi:hypothetical protein
MKNLKKTAKKNFEEKNGAASKYIIATMYKRSFFFFGLPTQTVPLSQTRGYVCQNNSISYSYPPSSQALPNHYIIACN